LLPRVSVAGVWLQDSRIAPLHPTVIAAEWNGKTYPVTGVDGDEAEILVDGKVVRLHSRQKYLMLRAASYLAGNVRFLHQDAFNHGVTEVWHIQSAIEGDRVEVPGGYLSLNEHYSASLVPSRSFPHAFLAVVFFQMDPTGLPDPESEVIAFHELGDLVADKKVDAKIDCAAILPKGEARHHYFTLVFSEGREIGSEQSRIAAPYFRYFEMKAHAQVLAPYRQQFATASRPAVAYLRISPELPDGTDVKQLPKDIHLKFSVVETGEVDAVEYAEPLPAAVQESLRTAVTGWLFLPRLRDGIPVRSQITLPLSFY
jgi:hypothetical protein